VKPAFKSLFKMMDPAEVGAGLLLGIKGNVFVGHGRSDSKALVSALALAKRAVDAKLITALSTRLDQAQSN
jgi:glycerol-3-phosphate acyltransferase PlsX